MVVTRVEKRDRDFDNATAFAVSKPINLELLTQEFREACQLKDDENFGFITEQDPINASTSDPVIFWITFEDGSIPDVHVLKKTIKDHDPEKSVDEWSELVALAQAEKDFTPQQIQVVLRRLVLAGGI